MTLKNVECVTVVCDICGQTVDDFAADGSIHFADAREAVMYIGGVYEGRVYPAADATGGVLLDGGVYYCYACRYAPHEPVPGQLIAELCARCGTTDDEHGLDPLAELELLQTGGPGPADHPGWAATARPASCTIACASGHQYAAAGVPQPADRSRIEFTAGTDRWAARRDDEQAIYAGFPAEMGWTLYPGSTGHTWTCLQMTFGPALRDAILLVPAGVIHPR